MSSNYILIFILSTALIGVFICIQIILLFFKKDNRFIRSICPIKTQSSCNSVLHSPASRITKDIHVVDIGLIYFLSQALFFLYSGTYNPSNENPIIIYTFPCIVSFLLSLLAIIYQARVIKQWCAFCLIIAGIVWCQAALVIYALVTKGEAYQYEVFNFPWLPKFLPFLLCLLLSAILAVLWLFVKPAFIKSQSVKNMQNHLSKMKQDVSLFFASLQFQRTIDNITWPEDIIIGNNVASLKLVVLISPYCKSCGIEFQILCELMRQHSNYLLLTIRFAVNPNDATTRTKTVSTLLFALLESPESDRLSILENWFRKTDLSVFTKEAGQKKNVTVDLLWNHHHWFTTNKITKTPSLFINGHELPEAYHPRDLLVLIPKILMNKESIFKFESIGNHE